MASPEEPTDSRALLRGGLPDRYLTPEDLVTMFSLPSVETVYQWRRKRIGPPRLPGRPLPPLQPRCRPSVGGRTDRPHGRGLTLQA